MRVLAGSDLLRALLEVPHGALHVHVAEGVEHPATAEAGDVPHATLDVGVRATRPPSHRAEGEHAAALLARVVDVPVHGLPRVPPRGEVLEQTVAAAPL